MLAKIKGWLATPVKSLVWLIKVTSILVVLAFILGTVFWAIPTAWNLTSNVASWTSGQVPASVTIPSQTPTPRPTPNQVRDCRDALEVVPFTNTTDGRFLRSARHPVSGFCAGNEVSHIYYNRKIGDWRWGQIPDCEVWTNGVSVRCFAIIDGRVRSGPLSPAQIERFR